MPGGNIVKVGVIVACLVVAVVVFMVTNKGEKPRYTGAVTDRDMVCTKCQDHFIMSLEQYDAAVKAAPRPPADSGGAAGPRATRGTAKPIMLKCAKCGETAALLAAKCPQSDKWYPRTNPDGTQGKCPD